MFKFLIYLRVRLLNVMSRDNKYVNLVFEHLDCDLYQYITDPCYSKDSITKKVGILFSL